MCDLDHVEQDKFGHMAFLNVLMFQGQLQCMYVCWGRTSCPTGQGTEFLYSERGAGSRLNFPGGGANHLCKDSS